MTTFTKNEQAAYNEILSTSMSGSVAGLDDCIRATGLDAKQVRGVLASLSRKGKIYIEECDINGKREIMYWPEHPEHGACFWCDVCDSEEAAAHYITDAQIA